MWRDASSIEAELETLSPDELQTIEDLFGMTDILDSAVLPDGYRAPAGLAQLIQPSEYGAQLIAKLALEDWSDAVEPDDLALAILLKLYHYDLLIDCRTSNPVAAWALFERQLRAGELRLPQRFGRTLYDRFNDSPGNARVDHLSADQIDELLGDTEQGVYQVGRLVTGPLGVMVSAERRYLPAVASLPLWHCADTGCRHTHNVKLLIRSSKARALSDLLDEVGADEDGPASEWGKPLAFLHRRHNPSRGREYYDLAGLIADAVPGGERTSLLARALRSEWGDGLRNALASKAKSLAQGSAEAVAERLSDVGALQILLLLEDRSLVKLLDESIWARDIRVPLTETRRAKNAPPQLSAYDTSATVSAFGVRANHDNPALFLSSTIWREYEKANQLGELSWRCQKSSATPHPSLVLEYMRNRGPREAIKNLVLSSGPIALAVADQLLLEFAPADDETLTIDRLLWKFGFDSERYDSKYDRLLNQLKMLREEVIRYRPKMTEDDRDAIRGKGVNVFVSLENILEEIVSYNVWLLSSDHFLVTRFDYRPSEAVAKVSDVLGPYVEAGGHRFVWNPQGGNVLGTLMLYARAASNWMGTLVGRDKGPYRRPDEELPHYADLEDRRFAFVHREFWADVDQSELANFVREFDALVGQFEQSKLAEVRSGLDHYREEDRFPSTDLLVACEARLTSAIEFADVNRFIPKFFWRTSYSVNSFGFSESVLSDAGGKAVKIGGPSSLSGFPGVPFATAVLVPFGNLLGDSSGSPIFRVKEESVYSALWSNYPRRLDVFIDDDEGGGLATTSRDGSAESSAEA